MTESVSVTQHVEASPEAVYRLVTDLPRMGEWSPENTGGRWLGGATGAAPGAKFRGTNREGGWRRWSTTVTVVEATEPSSFVFDVSFAGLPIARWGYRIAPSGTGSDVTESWEDRRARWMRATAGPLTGVSDRRTHNEAGMRTTLERLKAALESA